MAPKYRAFTLMDLVGVITVVIVIVALGFPSLFRARELSRRMVCSANLMGIGAVGNVYAEMHNDSWPVPSFKASAINNEGITYLKDRGTIQDWPHATEPGEVGYDRNRHTHSETDAFPAAGSVNVSVTRAYWMLVRTGDIAVQQFICPSSRDEVKKNDIVELYFDFAGYSRISYAYQVPFGPIDTRPRRGMDNRQCVAADKGPFYQASNFRTWDVGEQGLVTLDDVPEAWRPFNSPNHGGMLNGEGQNCLSADGHVSFQRIPAVGVDNDNIYTLITIEWGSAENFNVIHGDTPHQSPAGNPYPGQNSFSSGPKGFASTDTLLYP